MQELSRWLTGTEELFYRVPLPGRPRLQTCPACRDSGDGPSKMSAGHVFGDCSAIESARSRLKIRGFITEYEAIGNEDISPFAAFCPASTSTGPRSTLSPTGTVAKPSSTSASPGRPAGALAEKVRNMDGSNNEF